MASDRYARSPVLLWLGLGGSLVVILLCASGLVVTGAIGKIGLSSSKITITNIILTTGLDAQGRPIDNVTHFDPNVGRIYCVVTINAPKPINVGMRWYYNDTLIMDQSQTMNKSGYMSIYRKDGSSFPEGRYRVEIYLVRQPERIVYFIVGQ